MKTSLLALCVLLAAPAFAAESRAPQPPALHLSLSFRGTLHDALKELADKGHLSLVITSPLDQSAEVYLKDVTAEEALQSIAGAYQLKLDHQGNVWTVHSIAAATPASAPATAKTAAAEAGESAEADKSVKAKDDSDDDSDKEEDSEQEEASAPSMPAIPPIPPIPPVPHAPKFHFKMGHRHGANHDYSVTGNGHVAEGTTVGDAAALGGNLVVDGDVDGDASAVGGNLDIHGHVNGDASAIGGNVHLYSDCAVRGDVQAIGGTVIRDEGAEVGGEIGNMAVRVGPVIKQIKEKNSESKEERERSAVLGFFLRFAVLFALGFLSMIFAPSRMKQIETELKSDPVRCGLTGLVGSFALIALTVLLCITVIGIPFALALWIAVGVGMAMGVSAVASEIGLRLPFFRSRKTQALVLAMGLFVMLVGELIPVIGPISMAIISLIALGAIIRTRFGSGRRQGIPERLEDQRMMATP